ncbi:MAG: tetratricopeptide repeat protein [Phycisphaerales bacterium]
MPSSLHSPLTRFMAGAYSLTASAAAGNALGAATAGIAISNPLGLGILSALAAFAGGAAIYTGHKQAKADDRTTEAHNYLEQLINQHGDLTRALAAVPDDIPLNHAESCDRIHRIASIFTADTNDIESRLKADSVFTAFVSESMSTIETMLTNQQHDLDRLTQLTLNNKNLSEDQLTVIDAVAESLGLLHEKADKTLDTVQQIRERQGEQLTRADLDRLESNLLAKLQNQGEKAHADPETNKDLTAAVQRLADDAERGVYTAERVIKTNDPNALPTYLKVRRERLLEAKAALDQKVQAEAIQLDREFAAVAFVTGQIDEALEALNRIIDLNLHDLDAINRLGQIYVLKGDLPAAEKQYQKLLQLDLSPKIQAVALGNLGPIERTRGNLDAAEDYLQRSLKLNESLDSPEGMAGNLGNLGLIERTRGNLDAAEDYHQRSLKLNESLGHPEGMAIQLGNLGSIERIRGNLDAAEDYHQRSLRLNESFGHPEGMATQFGNLGLIERSRGNLDAAEDYFQRSLKIDEAIGRPEGMAIQLGNLGLIERSRGNLDAAEEYYQRSLKLNESLGCPEGMAIQLGNLGVMEGTRRNLDAAEDYHQRSLKLNESLGLSGGMAGNLGNLGVIEMIRGNLDAAEDYFQRSLKIDETIGRSESMANQFGNLGVIEIKRGNLTGARKNWTRARCLYAEIGMPHMVERVQGFIDELAPTK